MKFTKMHTLGNDYICINCLEECVRTPEQLAIRLCDRHYGIGADGMILVAPSQEGAFQMKLYNMDGSEAKMCGNGIRCLGKYVYEHGLIDSTTFKVETLAGVRWMQLELAGNQVEQIRVNMGHPRLNAHSIPILCERDMVIREPIYVGQQMIEVTGVSMGNPHVVIFTEDVEQIAQGAWGRPLEFHEKFPERMNIEYCQVINSEQIKVRVWERGVGETLACGTGACAAVVAAVLNNRTRRIVQVVFAGGEVWVEWNEKTNEVYLTGTATQVFEGQLTE